MIQPTWVQGFRFSAFQWGVIQAESRISRVEVGISIGKEVLGKFARRRDRTSAKGLRKRSSPMCTLSQNGYGVWNGPRASAGRFCKANRKRRTSENKQQQEWEQKPRWQKGKEHEERREENCGGRMEGAVQEQAGGKRRKREKRKVE